MQQWLLPHFPVLRPDKPTSKVRIVFDVSAKCENFSLNDVIDVGPKLQRDLIDVLLCFRKEAVAMVCDIAEMYLQIGIAEKRQKTLRFLWRGSDQSRPPDRYGEPSSEEIDDVETCILMLTQKDAFVIKYKVLSQEKKIANNSALSKLRSKLWTNGFIRCDGRFNFAKH